MNKFAKQTLKLMRDTYISAGYPLQPITKYIQQPMRWYYHQSPLLRHDSKRYLHPYLLNILHSLFVLEHPIDFTIYQDKIKFRSHGSLMSAQAYYVGEIEYHLVQYVLSQIKPNFVMLDIGAHHGAYTLIVAYELKKRGWQGVIHSFEPDPINFSLLKYNVEQNNLEEYVVLHNKAVSNFTGKQSFFFNLKENSDNFIDFANPWLNRNYVPEVYEQKEIEVVRIDDFIDELSHINMVKIDIQGGEPLALTGGKTLIEKNKPVCIVEAVPDWETTKQVEIILQEYNYSINCIDNQGRLCNRDSSQVFVSWDWVGIPK